MWWRSMNSLANSLLPSNCAPFAEGPMTAMCCVAASSLKKSKMPCTNGSSGPTTIMSILCSRAKALRAGKSVALMATFSPTALVPALPGAIYSFSILGLCAIFQAKACSRPPEPSNNTFILWIRLIVYCWKCVRFINNPRNIGLSFRADVRGRVPKRCAYVRDR